MSAAKVATRIGNLLSNLRNFDEKSYSELYNGFFNILSKNKHILRWTDICKMKKGQTIKLCEPQMYDSVTTYKHESCDNTSDPPFLNSGYLIYGRKKSDTYFTNYNGLVVTGSGSDMWIKLDKLDKLTKILDNFERKLTRLIVNMDKNNKDKDKDIKQPRDKLKKRISQNTICVSSVNPKTTSPHKTRKGPKESATLFKIGVSKKGLDGNMWFIQANKNGIQRWVKK